MKSLNLLEKDISERPQKQQIGPRLDGLDEDEFSAQLGVDISTDVVV